MSVQTMESQFQMVKIQLDILEAKQSQHPMMIVSTGNFAERGTVTELYGKTYQSVWHNFLSYVKKNQLTSACYFRIDILTEERQISFEQLQNLIRSVKRNNYGDFNFRIEGKQSYSFLMEELAGNAILRPSKEHKVGRNLPNLSIDEQNYRGYIKRKYGKKNANVNLLKQSKIFLFKTKAFYFEQQQVFPIIDYGNGNRVREITYSNVDRTTDLVIEKGAAYLNRQLTDSGQFIYGYFPCYDQSIKGYNSVRHFSSIYALAEAAAYLKDRGMYSSLKQSVLWGVQNLIVNKEGYTVVEEPLKNGAEYKLGAQATAILAIAKYIEVTGDPQFNAILQKLILVVKEKFITKDNRTIHVLDESLTIKEKFRIEYYDGEILFALLRAYGVFKEEKIMKICEDLMAQFIANDYQKYHDHWLSYAVNEFLRYKKKEAYYRFGLDNALGNIRFIEKRDTAYPTMLELLVAASKMIDKLEVSGLKAKIFNQEEEFETVKNRINAVMKKRVLHELTTGVMFPEFAQFFKKPEIVSFGFFARHDRFRMRIDDAEHFLSGLINYRLQVIKEEERWLEQSGLSRYS
ncbi:hypothetical protein [Enterococcus sp.]|uniref:hypothetical protein n=1 Tax=Enterococcus sp. TaxID=35783 RepID=UPI00290F92FD|nr:hypothetical protein [Enterococcus sp.]MDU5333318.1 hypothetical protein [Enterococcus sp.]